MTHQTIYDIATRRAVARGVGIVCPDGCVSVDGLHDLRLTMLGGGQDDYGAAVYSAVSCIPPRPADTQTEGWEWDDEEGEWRTVMTVAGLRASRWAQLRERRNELEVAPLLVDGMLFDVDERAVARISLALKQADLTPGWAKDWTLADNTVAQITAPVLMRVLLALAARGEQLHATGRALRQRIAEAATAAQIKAVTWPEEAADAYA